VTDSERTLGDAIHFRDAAAKGRSGRVIPSKRKPRAALMKLQEHNEAPSRHPPIIISSECSPKTAERGDRESILCLLPGLSFSGWSSHSERRICITKSARHISTVEGSLRDIQSLAASSALCPIQRHIEADMVAQGKLVELVLGRVA
jgi:hypothetical protein